MADLEFTAKDASQDLRLERVEKRLNEAIKEMARVRGTLEAMHERLIPLGPLADDVRKFNAFLSKLASKK